ncbi:MAG: elongation factor P 5-aminopentanone reductase [Ruminococcus sp.]
MKTKTVLITGASRGIGEACARLFARNGYRMILNCHNNSTRLKELKENLENEFSIQCMISAGNAGDESYVERLFQETEAFCGSLDILINNAGIAHMGLLQDMTLAEWNRVINTNLTSQFLCCRKAIPLMLKEHSGSIVNISSVWGIHGAACEAAYSASKGGVNAFTRALARELAPSHIRVNAVAFGAVDTDMNSMLSREEKQALCDEIPLERMGTPEEGAEFVYDVAVNHPYLTAQVLTLDGGWI